MCNAEKIMTEIKKVSDAEMLIVEMSADREEVEFIRKWVIENHPELPVVFTYVDSLPGSRIIAVRVENRQNE